MSIRSLDLHSFQSTSLAEPEQTVGVEMEELKWIAEAVVGDRQSVESCIAFGLVRANGSVYVAPNWRNHWVKRCVAREALGRIQPQLNGITAKFRRKSNVMRASKAPMWDRHKFRSLSAIEVCKTLNAFERAALILHLYLNFSVHDCALLIECHWSLIEPACANALWRLFGQPISADGPASSLGFSEAMA